MGAVGALVMAMARGRLDLKRLTQALDSTARLATFVMFILVGSTVFSFTFNAADGPAWVEGLFESIPGGALGFLIVVNLLVFVLGFFLDFFEIAFIVIPMLTPVAEKLLPALLPGVPVDAVMIWFGVLLALNMQTSFLTPPFGFALFYLRSVAARSGYRDGVTGRAIPAVTTGQIYRGSIAFIVLQLVMVAGVIAFPQLVVGSLHEGPAIDAEQALERMVMPERAPPEPMPGPPGTDAAAEPSPPAPSDDPNQAVLDAIERERGSASGARRP